jgi:hydroxyethylthiazole kinase-like uncharacterized protein yjeF
VTNYSSLAAGWAQSFATMLGGATTEGLSQSSSEALELLAPEEMAEADNRTIAAGTPGIVLMERAGEAVATAAHDLAAPGGRIVVLAGPGNNGGDGFVAARHLATQGFRVSVALLGSRDRLKGDAALAANAWTGAVGPLGADSSRSADLVVDALFGAGLDRPITGMAAEAIDGANRGNAPILAVDLPSGVDGRTGQILGTAIAARRTVTFFRLKPGHLLFPGRMFAGSLVVADIGIDPGLLAVIGPRTFRNLPGLWLSRLPRPHLDGHKYHRGHAIVVSGPMTRTGAARLAARAALRVGAGLVSVASPTEALAVNAAQLTAIMLLAADDAADLATILSDPRRNAVVMGPALGVGENTIALVEAALGSDAASVLDADALTSFADDPDRLLAMIRPRSAPTVLTPHDGEFARVFPDLAGVPSKLDRSREAAVRSGAIIVLKGPDTVVAAPDGRAAIADNAPADLATAGAGDVLAGFVGGLLAQRMPAFEAAEAAVWLHGAAARVKGRGLIAEDIAEALPVVFTELAGYAR